MKLIDGDLLATKAKPAKSYHGNMLVVCVGDIVAAPEADTVAVVRCSDCKHWRRYSCDCRYSIAAQLDGFCSHGAKMEVYE